MAANPTEPRPRDQVALLLDRHLKDAAGKIVGIRTVFAPIKLES